MKMIKIKIMSLMLLLLLATSSTATADPMLAISVGDTFDYNFKALTTVEINGTDYSDPNADAEETVNVEVIEIKSDNLTVSVKETYSDDSTDLVDSAVDTWEGFFFFTIVLLIFQINIAKLAEMC